ncbi:MAG: hypothetical protein LBT97_07820 [Planctomycetota bacterium]|jgi:tetratricopeptide (TPR) repeat protein|nr:hypothetical protein [Planctomycetota bacterium]
MNAYRIVALLVFLVAAAALFVRYVYLAVDREFRNLARAENDAAYRGEEIAGIDKLLAARTPIPDGGPALARPSPGGWRLLPPAFMALGVLLLWGSAFSPPGESAVWAWGGVMLAVPSAAAMLFALRGRARERGARLLRYRADLRRLDGDMAGAAADLRQLLALTPWDDAAWAEYADDLAGAGRFGEAREAVGKALALDPGYEDYHCQSISLALRMRRPELAKEDFSAWEAPIPPGDGARGARRLAYSAALAWADGNADAARRSAADAIDLDQDAFWVAVDLDPALHALRDLLDARPVRGKR